MSLHSRPIIYLSFQIVYWSYYSVYPPPTLFFISFILFYLCLCLSLCLLDLKKAFDLVDHNITMYKLGCYLQNSSSLPFFKSYLEGRTQSVFLHGSYSSEGSVKFGVPQGSVSGPTLFSIFFNDLPLHVMNISVACDMLADDTTLHTSGKDIMQVEHTLQESLDQVSC